MRTVVYVQLLLLTALSPVQAFAFHRPEMFAKSAVAAGGNGIYFTGSPRFLRYDCTMCHITRSGKVEVELSSNPPGLFSEGLYRPDTNYNVRVRFPRERQGLSANINPNVFALELSTRDNQRGGTIERVEPSVVKVNDPNLALVVADGEHNAVTEWSFVWRAPAASTGSITAYLAAIDGDGAISRFMEEGDPYNDDVTITSFRFAEEGAPLERREGPVRGASGCNVNNTNSHGRWLAFLLTVFVCCLRKRSVWLIALTIGLLGCYDPHITAPKCQRQVCPPRELPTLEEPDAGT